MWFWLLLLLPEIHYANERCGNIACEHDHVSVCGIRNGGSSEVSLRLFQDECVLRKFECETGMKGFRLTSMELCAQSLSLDTGRNGKSAENVVLSLKIEDSELSHENGNTTLDLTRRVNSEHSTCIQCDCNVTSKSICAIRGEGARFLVRWFADECHMLLYNCENNLNFTETDEYICVGNNNYQIASKTDKMESIGMTGETDNVVDETYEDLDYQTCVQRECVPNHRMVCGVRPEHERFVIRWFNDTCQMLKYNCKKHLNFSVIDDFVCVGDNLRRNNRADEEIITFDDVIGKVENNTELLELAEQAYSETLDPIDENRSKLQNENDDILPNTVVVAQFDLNENINQTVDTFFATTHSTGISLQKLENEETRRMIIKDTGPRNYFVARTRKPSLNYTIPTNQSKKFPEYAPLLKYCYHKCPQKCPDFYKPVCGGKAEETRYTPYVFYRNHCYFDMAKCQMWWANFRLINFTDLEEVGFIFCGGFKLMNQYYMFPLIKILQKMGRMEKKGRIHFKMRNLGQFNYRLQG